MTEPAVTNSTTVLTTTQTTNAAYVLLRRSHAKKFGGSLHEQKWTSSTRDPDLPDKRLFVQGLENEQTGTSKTCKPLSDKTWPNDTKEGLMSEFTGATRRVFDEG